jgi:hypothetical protein
MLKFSNPKIGGSRNGAGLATDAAGLKTAKHTVTLDVVTVDRLKELGAGNLSRGIRQAARRLADKAKSEPTNPMQPAMPSIGWQSNTRREP